MEDINRPVNATPHSLLLPDFVREVSAGQVRARQLRHNLVSWLTVPCRLLPRRRQAGTCGILMYHRVCPTPTNRFSPTYSVTPARFANQLKGLLRRGYRAFSLDQVVAAHRTGERLSQRAFAVTFDDGYANNYLYALPVLEELKVPATVFLATAYIGCSDPFPFDDWMVGASKSVPSEAWRPLTLDECRRMLDSGLIQFGAHTHTHADFRGDSEKLADDLRDCVTFLAKEFSINRPAAAYPFGDPRNGFASDAMASIVAKLGCNSAFQIGNCCVKPTDDLYHLPRFDVAPGDCGASLAGKLDGWAEVIRNSLGKLKRVRVR